MSRAILDQMIPERGERIPRSSLSSITKRNLSKLEEFGFSFEDVAYKFPTQQTHYSKAVRTAFSFLIHGMGPQGEDIRYVRRETKSPIAGQTLLYIDGVRHQMTCIVEGLQEGLNLEHVRKEYAKEQGRKRG